MENVEKFLTGNNVIVFCLVTLMICWAYNIISTSVQNAREEKKRSKEPFNRIDKSIEDMRIKCSAHVQDVTTRVEGLEHRMVDTDRQLKELHQSQAEDVIALKDIDSRVGGLERHITEHDAHLKDLHAGQSAICRGVQALIDHELHNGNEEELKAASDGIAKWLRTR